MHKYTENTMFVLFIGDFMKKKNLKLNGYPTHMRGFSQNRFGGHQTQRMRGFSGAKYGAANEGRRLSDAEIQQWRRDNGYA